MNIADQGHSMEYRVFYAVVFLPVLLFSVLCLLLPKHINPFCGNYAGRSPFAQARAAASGVVPYIFRT